MRHLYKIHAVLDGETSIFKRWGEDEGDARRAFETFMSESYPETRCTVESVEKDKAGLAQ